MVYVREINGKLVVASDQWARLYEMGGLCDKDPVGAFETKQRALDFISGNSAANAPKRLETPKLSLRPSEADMTAFFPSASQTGSQYPSSPQERSAPMSKAEYRRSQMKDYTPNYRPVIIQVHYGPSNRPTASKPYVPAYKTKDEAMRAALQELCDRYKFHAQFRGGLVDITTVAGEWFFRYNDRPIQLFHKNPSTWYFGDGTAKPGDYHNQMMRFYSPADVLQYIYAHEQKRIQLLAEGQEHP